MWGLPSDGWAMGLIRWIKKWVFFGLFGFLSDFLGCFLKLDLKDVSGSSRWDLVQRYSDSSQIFKNNWIYKFSWVLPEFLDAINPIPIRISNFQKLTARTTILQKNPQKIQLSSQKSQESTHKPKHKSPENPAIN